MRYFSIAISIFIGGCQDMYGYELASISRSCGGYENINRVWFDVVAVRARCIDGKLVTAGIEDK